MKIKSLVLTSFVICILLPLHAWAGFKPSTPIRICVRAQTYPAGQDVQNSVDDVRNSIQKKNDWWKLVDKPEDAQLILEIVKREGDSYSMTDYNTTSHQSETVPRNTYTVYSELSVGSYTTSLMGISQDSDLRTAFWKGAAGDLIERVKDWVKENYSQLLSKNPSATFSPSKSDKPSLSASPNENPPAAKESEQKTPLANQDIIALVAAGLDEQNTIRTIKEASSVNFDLSIEGLKKLLSSGISNNVIAAMQARMTASKHQ